MGDKTKQYGDKGAKVAITAAIRYAYMKVFKVSDFIDDELHNVNVNRDDISDDNPQPLASLPPTDKNAIETKQTTKKAESSKVEESTEPKVEEKRPFGYERLLSGYTKKKLSDPRPVTKESMDIVRKRFELLAQGDKDRIGYLKDFFGIHNLSDITFGSVVWMQNWIEVKEEKDGSVTLNPLTKAEFLGIIEHMESQTV
jgi:hypothetical protein